MTGSKKSMIYDIKYKKIRKENKKILPSLYNDSILLLIRVYITFKKNRNVVLEVEFTICI